MKTLLIILFAFLTISAQELIAKDSSGFTVMLKEKYGGWLVDSSCTVVMLYNRMFILAHKDKPSSYFSIDNYSIQIVKK